MDDFKIWLLQQSRTSQRLVLMTLSLFAGLLSAAFVFLSTPHLYPVLNDTIRAEISQNAMIAAFFVTVPIIYLYLSTLLRVLLANQALQQLASYDALTGCLNRGAFQTEVEEWLRTHRRSSEQSALLLLDADHFKKVNDTLGHIAGDDALRLISTILREMARSGDLIGRVGGEEFGVFLKCAGTRDSLAVADRMRRAVFDARFAPHGPDSRMVLSVSIGHANSYGHSSFTSLFREADDCLYRAKARGRNRVETAALADVDPDLANMVADQAADTAPVVAQRSDQQTKVVPFSKHR